MTTKTAAQQVADVLASLREFTYSALDGTSHQENLEHYDRLATEALERFEAECPQLAALADEHTSEPWHVSRKVPHLVSAANGDAIAEFDGSVDDLPRSRDVANARRTVACVNYCAGIPTGRLESEIHARAGANAMSSERKAA